MNKGQFSNPLPVPCAEPGMVKAWVKFKYTATYGVQILAAYNVAEVKRNGTGDYTVTFMRPFVTPHYAVCITPTNPGGQSPSGYVASTDTNSAGSKRIQTSTQGVGLFDAETYFMALGEQ